MVLTDYFRWPRDSAWDVARQCGVEYATVRAPDSPEFDPADPAHWQQVYDGITAFGVKPLVLEPMPPALHEHIKTGDSRRDWAIEQVCKMLPVLDRLDIRTLCFNWMAHVGWYRNRTYPERGGARVTGFSLADYIPTEAAISRETLWENYAYFLRAVVPVAEKHGIRLALHPDDPPVDLGKVSRIMTDCQSICRAVRDIYPSPNLGVTLCQACFSIMGEDLEQVIPTLADKIFFVHFRNVRGSREDFRETFHDSGVLDMVRLLELYKSYGVDVPIRVDHVPAMVGEEEGTPGYGAMGRFFAIGYLKGLLQAAQ